MKDNTSGDLSSFSLLKTTERQRFPDVCSLQGRSKGSNLEMNLASGGEERMRLGTDQRDQNCLKGGIETKLITVSNLLDSNTTEEDKGFSGALIAKDKPEPKS